jgi:hypothetical protein
LSAAARRRVQRVGQLVEGKVEPADQADLLGQDAGERASRQVEGGVVTPGLGTATAAPMTIDQLAARIRPLELLAMGLRKEIQSFDPDECLLGSAERADYVESLRVAATALEAARVPLTAAWRRLNATAP